MKPTDIGQVANVTSASEGALFGTSRSYQTGTISAFPFSGANNAAFTVDGHSVALTAVG